MPRAWSAEEHGMLVGLASRLSSRQAATAMGRTLISVRRYAQGRGIKFAMRGLGGHLRGKVARNWDRAEDNRLRMLVGEMAYDKIAAELGRSKTSIACRVYQLKIPATQGRYTMVEAAGLIGVSDTTVGNYRRKLRASWRRGRGAEPGLTAEDVSRVAQEILRTPTSHVAVTPRLRRAASGDL